MRPGSLGQGPTVSGLAWTNPLVPPGEYLPQGSECSPLRGKRKEGRKKPAQLAAWAAGLLLLVGVWFFLTATGHGRVLPRALARDLGPSPRRDRRPGAGPQALAGMPSLGPAAVEELTAGVMAVQRQVVGAGGLLPERGAALAAHLGRMGILAAPGGGLDASLHGHGSILGAGLLAGLRGLNPAELDRLAVPEVVPQRQTPSGSGEQGEPADLENEALVWLRADTGVTEDAAGVSGWAVAAGVDALGLRRSLAAVARPRGAAPQRRMVAGFPVIEFPSGAATGLRIDDAALEIPQPFLLVVVANPAGDATLLADGGSKDATAALEFQLCHGFPEHGAARPRVALVASGEGEDPPDPPEKILHGQTRDTRAWHVYSAVVAGPQSELYVDGVREAAGDPGPHGLHGLTIGADSSGAFGMGGGLLELVIVPGLPSIEARRALELRLAARYAPVFASPAGAGWAQAGRWPA